MQIVWDPEKKRWINLEEDTNEGSSEIKPPPKMSDLMSKVPSAVPSGTQPMHETSPFQYSSESVPSFDMNVPMVDVGLRSNNQFATEQRNVQNFGNAKAADTIPAVPAAPYSTTQPTPTENAGIPNSLQPNMFKLQRNRSKCLYINA